METYRHVTDIQLSPKYEVDQIHLTLKFNGDQTLHLKPSFACLAIQVLSVRTIIYTYHFCLFLYGSFGTMAKDDVEGVQHDIT